MKMKLSLLAASAILAVGMTGCWTENAPTTTEAKIVANALDGYLVGSTVCVDKNSDGICQSSEPQSYRTGENGSYTLLGDDVNYPVIVTDGNDTDLAGTADPVFHGVLMAPKGSTMATPLTTLKASGMSDDQIMKLLGVTTLDLSLDYRKNYNPTYSKGAATIQTILATFASVFTTSSTTSNVSTMNAIVAALKTEIDNGHLTAAALSNPTTLATSFVAMTATINTTLKTSVASTQFDALSTATADVNKLDFSSAATAATATQTVATKVAENTIPSNIAITKAVTIADNNFTVGNTSTSFTQAGVFRAVSASASNTTIGFTLKNTGDELSSVAKTMDVAIQISGTGSDKRKLNAVLKGVQVTSNGITVPTGAMLYVDGKDSNGATVIPISIPDNMQDDFKTVSGYTTFNLTSIMSRIEAKASGKFLNITKEGTYDVSFIIGGNIDLGFDGSIIKVLTAPKVSVTVYSNTVTGSKFTGTLTVTK